MSHIDDPAQDPKRGVDNQAGLSLADMTREQFYKTVKNKTGKTDDELLSMDDSVLNDLIKTSFTEKTDSAGDGTETISSTIAGSDPVKKPEEKTEEEEQVTLSIRPSVLKGFATGKQLREAVLEAITTAKESQGTIDLLQKETIPNLRKELETQQGRVSSVVVENNSLKRELDELRSKKEAAATKQNTDTDETLPEVPKLPDEFDPLDPEHRESFLNALSTMRKRDQILLNKLSKKEQPAPPAATQVPAEQSRQTQQPSQEQAAVDEFAAVRAIQNTPTIASILQTSRDIVDINKDYIDFGVKVAKMCGIENPFDEHGMFNENASLKIHQYLDPSNEAGEKLRVQGKKEGVVEPAQNDLNALRRLSTIRSIQRERSFKDGSGKTTYISSEDAYAIAKHNNPKLFDVKSSVDTRREDLERMERATANRAKHTVDVPPGVGSDANDLSKISSSELEKITKKDQSKWTVAEMELVKNTCRANGLSEDEITFFLEQQKTK